MANLTSANAVITLQVAGVFSTSFRLEGFSADNIFDAPETEFAQTAMGVDGRLSAGMVFNPFVQTFMIQADSSETLARFERWAERQQTNRTVYEASGTTKLVSVNRSYILKRGFLTTGNQVPPAGRILQPRRFTITWESVTASPIV